MYFVAQQCRIDTRHQGFPVDLDLLEQSVQNDKKCSSTVFTLSAVGANTECELKCKSGYFNSEETVKVSCTANADATSPDGNTGYVRCAST